MLKLFFWLLLIGNGILFAMQRGYVGAATPERHEPQRLAQQLQPQTLLILPADGDKPPAPAPVPTPATAPAAADSATSAMSAAKPEGEAGKNDAMKNDLAKSDAAPGMVVDNPKPATTADANAAAKTEARTATRNDTRGDIVACTEIGNFNSVEVRRFESQLAALNLAVKASSHNVQEVGSNMVYIPSEGKEGAERRVAELRRLGIQDFYVIPESQPNPALHWAISLGVFKTEDAAKAYIGQLIPKGVRSARIMARNVTSNKLAYQWRNIDAASKKALDGLADKFPAQEQRACSS